MHKYDTQDVFSLSPTLFVAPLENNINHNDSSLMTQLDYHEKWPLYQKKFYVIFQHTLCLFKSLSIPSYNDINIEVI